MSKYCGIPNLIGSTGSRKITDKLSLNARLMSALMALRSSAVIRGLTALGHSFQKIASLAPAMSVIAPGGLN